MLITLPDATLIGSPTCPARPQIGPGHDRRYSVDCSRLRSLGWEPAHQFADALNETVEWYLAREDCWPPLKCVEYRDYYVRQYGARLEAATAVMDELPSAHVPS